MSGIIIIMKFVYVEINIYVAILKIITYSVNCNLRSKQYFYIVYSLKTNHENYKFKYFVTGLKYIKTIIFTLCKRRYKCDFI